MSVVKVQEDQYNALQASIQELSAVITDESVEIASKLAEVIEALQAPDVDLSVQVSAIAELKERVEALSDSMVDNPVVVPEPAVEEQE